MSNQASYKAHYQVPVDTFHFSPYQIHPRAALRMEFGSVAQCVRNQIMRWSQLIERHRWSFVLVGFDLRYGAVPLAFESAGDWLAIDGRLVLRGGGSLVEHHGRIAGDADNDDARVIHATTLWRPVRLTGTDELAGTPQRADEWLSSHFGPEDRDPSKAPRPVPELLAQLEDYESLEEHEQHLTVTRDECELADQWQFISLAGYVARSRETLALGSADPRIKAGLAHPLSRVVAELTGPLYFASNVIVRTKALAKGDDIVFLHRVVDTSFAGRELPSATVVERFERPTQNGAPPLDHDKRGARNHDHCVV